MLNKGETMNIRTKRIIVAVVFIPTFCWFYYDKHKEEIDMLFDTSPEWVAYNDCIDFFDTSLGQAMLTHLTPEQAKQGCLDTYKARKAALKTAER